MGQNTCLREDALIFGGGRNLLLCFPGMTFIGGKSLLNLHQP